MPDTNTFGVEQKSLYKKVHITPLRGAYFELQPLQFREEGELLRSKSATPRYTEERKVRGNVKEILFKPVAPTPQSIADAVNLYRNQSQKNIKRRYLSKSFANPKIVAKNLDTVFRIV